MCYIGGNLSSMATLSILRERASKFLQVESYQTLAHEHSHEEWAVLLSKDLDVISFCSPSAVQSFVDQTKAFDLQAKELAKFAAIGSTTAASIKQKLRRSSILPRRHTFQEMIAEIVSIL